MYCFSQYKLCACCRYSATFFECPLQRSKQPMYISMVINDGLCDGPTNVIPVTSANPLLPYARRFTVCLTPLNNNYSRIHEIVEWIELNRLLGADKFVIYNYSSAANVEAVLNFYEQLKIVELVPWNLPLTVESRQVNVDPDIHYFGQLAALQDCLYRNKRESEYIVNEDLDEFIIPKFDNMTTWSDMLQTLPLTRGTFLFKNVFFRKDWANDDENFPSKYLAELLKLVTLLKTKHEKPTPFGNRTKYIAKTSAVTRLQIHTTYLPSKHGGIKLVPPYAGMLHHYRNWEKYQDDSEAAASGVDRTVIVRYGERLIANVLNVLRALKVNIV